LRDDDQYLRIEAIRVLSTCDCETTRHALRDSLVDTHPLVQEAAEAALAFIKRRRAPSAPSARLPAAAGAMNLAPSFPQPSGAVR
jgi:hypothetical protein